MSGRFQRAAAAFPLTRPIAQANAAAVFDVCAGFVYSQILRACVEAGLLERLAAGPVDPARFAADLALPEEGVRRLLDAAAALNLAERRSAGRFGLGSRGAALLGNPSVLDMIRHHDALYADLAAPLAMLRERRRDTRLAAFWSYGADRAQSADSAARYSELMARTQAFIARDVLDAFDVRRHRRALDIGGGSGAFLSAAAARAPDLRLSLFDLPDVAALAEARFKRDGLSDRACVYAGDVFSDPLPDNADLVTLVRVLHDHDDDKVRGLLQKIRTSMAPGGRLLVAEPMAGRRDAGRAGDAYFGMYLWAMGSGRPRTRVEISKMLREAGFTKVRRLRTRQPLLVSAVLAS